MCDINLIFHDGWRVSQWEANPWQISLRAPAVQSYCNIIHSICNTVQACKKTSVRKIVKRQNMESNIALSLMVELLSSPSNNGLVLCYSRLHVIGRAISIRSTSAISQCVNNQQTNTQFSRPPHIHTQRHGTTPRKAPARRTAL